MKMQIPDGSQQSKKRESKSKVWRSIEKTREADGSIIRRSFNVDISLKRLLEQSPKKTHCQKKGFVLQNQIQTRNGFYGSLSLVNTTSIEKMQNVFEATLATYVSDTVSLFASIQLKSFMRTTHTIKSALPVLSRQTVQRSILEEQTGLRHRLRSFIESSRSLASPA